MLGSTPLAKQPEIEAQAALESAVAAEAATPQIVESRFGPLEILPENFLTLPKGLFGFSDHHEFGLANLPEGKHPQFKALQCMTEPDLTFLVVPFNIVSGAIDDADINEACAALTISREELAIFLIITVRRENNEVQVSANLRAPIFIDIVRHLGRQYVLADNKYSIRHVL